MNTIKRNRTIKILEVIESDTYASYQAWTTKNIENLTGETELSVIAFRGGKYRLACARKDKEISRHCIIFNNKQKALRTQKLINKIK